MKKFRHFKLLIGATLLMLFGSSAQSCSESLCYAPKSAKIPANNVRDLGSDTTRIQQDSNAHDTDE